MKEELIELGAIDCVVENAEPKHYACLALLKLADNYETHLTIAEDGGIQALLNMGRDRDTIRGEELSYKTALTVGSLAKNVMKTVNDNS